MNCNRLRLPISISAAPPRFRLDYARVDRGEMALPQKLDAYTSLFLWCKSGGIKNQHKGTTIGLRSRARIGQ